VAGDDVGLVTALGNGFGRRENRCVGVQPVVNVASASAQPLGLIRVRLAEPTPPDPQTRSATPSDYRTHHQINPDKPSPRRTFSTGS